MNKFEKRIKFSVLCSIIDTSNVAITHNRSTLTMEKRIKPTLNDPERFELKFNNAITPGTVSSTLFTIGTIDYELDDDSLGNVRSFRTVAGVKEIRNATEGTINYETGEIIIIDFGINAIVDGGDLINIRVTPQNFDLKPLRDQILFSDPDNNNSINITLAQETE